MITAEQAKNKTIAAARNYDKEKYRRIMADIFELIEKAINECKFECEYNAQSDPKTIMYVVKDDLELWGYTVNFASGGYSLVIKWVEDD